jgi:hypothetical protein
MIELNLTASPVDPGLGYVWRPWELQRLSGIAVCESRPRSTSFQHYSLLSYEPEQYLFRRDTETDLGI